GSLGRLPRRCNSRLESESRPEGYFEVIMRAVIEVDLVTGLKTQSDGTPESFDSAAGVHGETGVPGLNAAQGSYEPCGSVLIGDAEINKAEFASDIGSKRSRAGLEFRSKQPGQGTQGRVYKLSRGAVREDAGEVPLEIVGHLGFQLNVGMYVERGAPAHADEVDMRVRGAEVQIIGEDPYFDMIRTLRHEGRRQS